jgi:ubiquinone/menaquinone biosynthesis C-methylase UbiE
MEAGKEPHGAGRSSFAFVDQNTVFSVLSLEPSAVFLDIGCGRGDYTLAAAERIGATGKVYAVDEWREGLDVVEQRAKVQDITNIVTLEANANVGIPLPDESVDIAFMATVFHDLLRGNTGETALREIRRVLRPTGRLAIIEFKKIEDSPGPPLEVRLSSDEVDEKIAPFGFTKETLLDVGPYHYLLTAGLQKGREK